MIIAGIQKLTLLDYPGKLAALLFTQGCNFACGYCHNAEMIPICKNNPQDITLLPEKILTFLKSRGGLLDGVVISGGEPTLQPGLQQFMAKIKTMGFLIKLDTNGSNPDILQSLLNENLIDYIAMDVKHTQKKMNILTREVEIDNIVRSMEIIKECGVDYEFRSTILPSYHKEQDIHEMGKLISGAKRWYLQNFRPLKTLNPKLRSSRSFTQKELNSYQDIAQKYAKHVNIRN